MSLFAADRSFETDLVPVNRHVPGLVEDTLHQQFRDVDTVVVDRYEHHVVRRGRIRGDLRAAGGAELDVIAAVSLEIAVGVQYIQDPALNPSESSIWMLNCRGRVVF